MYFLKYEVFKIISIILLASMQMLVKILSIFGVYLWGTYLNIYIYKQYMYNLNTYNN